ncbi:hypothetical protein [Streptomyces sp. AM8-1-1]|uniref:hypothetical protein n=1 Tax=Streptomyces sp. AM8-1-1 TaxID=3075825 RepID=UPI0028C49C05|nr:hypothetical protein [Streptomyces sp. AM8-1-1]WNO75313.1 hypothetical protein RPQ07_28515 [Streptomyces sp. AM8-1-1]
MTRTPLAPAPPAAIRPSRAAAVLRAVAIVACVPYVTLKTAWMAGSTIGIPDGSVLLGNRATLGLANGVTVLMDSAVVVLALLLTRPWGLRVRTWLLAFPFWVATGLLAPIMAGFPLQLLVSAFGGTTSADTATEPFLDDWVFGVVYGGFILQGLALGALFVRYARNRWADLWQARLRDLPAAPSARVAAAAGALAALLPAVMHLLWMCGATLGLSARRIDERAADFHVLEGVRLAFVLAAVAGALLLTSGRHRASSLPVKIPLGAAWVGSGALAAWGGWLLFASLMPQDDRFNRSTGLLPLTYAVEMIAGVLLIGAVVSQLRRRGA